MLTQVRYPDLSVFLVSKGLLVLNYRKGQRMRSSTRTIMALNLFVGSAVVVLGAWVPDAQAVRMPLWLTVAALSAVLVDRRFDARL